MGDDLRRRYCTGKDEIKSVVNAALEASLPGCWNLCQLGDLKLASDSEFIHAPSGTLFPIHTPILTEALKILSTIGIPFDGNISYVVKILETLDVPVATIKDFWSLLHGSNIFGGFGYETNHVTFIGPNFYRHLSFGSFMNRILPSVNVWNVIRALFGQKDPNTSAWFADFARCLLAILSGALQHYADDAVYSLESDISIDWNDDNASAIQSFVKSIVNADPNLDSTSLNILRQMYHLSSVILPTDESSRRKIWSWFNHDGIDINKTIFMCSTPYLVIYDKLSSNIYPDVDEYAYSPFAPFKRFQDQLHFSMETHAHSFLYLGSPSNYRYQTELHQAEGDLIESLNLPTNFTVTIEGRPNKVYQVHDFVLVQWRYFQRLLLSGMSECSTRSMQLPKDMPVVLLEIILAILYGVDIRMVKLGRNLLAELSAADKQFALDSATEYSLVPLSADQPIPQDPISQRFHAFLVFCYKSLHPIFSSSTIPIVPSTRSTKWDKAFGRPDNDDGSSVSEDSDVPFGSSISDSEDR